MIETLTGLHETVNYKEDMQMRLYNNDEAENYPPHWHTLPELIMPTQNSYRVVLGENDYTIREGEILIICPCVVHELFAPPEGKRIIFQPSLMEIDLKEIDLILSLISPAILITPDNYPQIHGHIRQLVLDIKEEYFQSSPYAETFIYSKFLELLVYVGRYYAEQAQNNFEAKNSKQKEYMDKFLLICNYINEHFAEDLTLESVASLAGFSKYYFTRLFKQYTDTSFYKYLNQKRVAHAKKLLIDKDVPVIEVALQSGFSTPSSFLRMFKLATGYTPTEFRKMYHIG